MTHNYDLSASGGNDKGNYYVSLGYINSEGIVLGTGYDRFSLTANGNYNLRSNLKLTVGLKHSTISNKATDPENSGTSTMDRLLRLSYDLPFCIMTMELPVLVKPEAHPGIDCTNYIIRIFRTKLIETRFS